MGEISKPVRTKFGYHILKVTNERVNRGEITVAHIMMVKPKEGTPSDVEKAKNTLSDIYKKVQQGENFETLASQFSEDKNSGSRGGALPRFASGQLSSEEFENVAFGLKNPGDFSEPFETQFGWHIVKLIEKHPLKKQEEMERELDSKIRKDDRSRIITNTLNTKLRQKYAVKRNEKLFGEIKKSLTDKYYTGEWKMPEDTKPFESDLFKIGGKSITGTVFLNDLQSQQKANSKIKPITKLVDKAYENFLDNQLNTYYNDNLENEFSEFANIVGEYRDGLLLFDLMEKEIWNKAKQDTIGLKNYFDSNKLKYQWKNRVEVLTASSAKEDFVKHAQKILKSDITADALKERLNTKEVINVMTKQETIEEGLDKNIAFKTGVSKIYKDKDFFYVNKVLKIIPAGQKTLEETKGKVINDYQQYLEDNWVTELKKEFKVNVNIDVFEKLESINEKIINNKKMKLFNKLSVIVSLVLITFSASAQKTKVDGVVGVVGDYIILDSDIDKTYLVLKQQGVDTKEISRCQMLGKLLEDKLYAHQAIQDSIVVTDSEVNQKLDEQYAYMVEQLGSKEKVVEYFKKSSEDELKTELFEIIKINKLTAEMQKKIVDEVTITPEEVRDFFKKIPQNELPVFGAEMELAQIVIKPVITQEAKQTVINQLKDFKKDILENGASFFTKAVLYSEDPGSKNNGGYYKMNRKTPIC